MSAGERTDAEKAVARARCSGAHMHGGTYVPHDHGEGTMSILVDQVKPHHHHDLTCIRLKDAAIAALEEESRRLVDAINWACGCSGSDFGQRINADAPRYWWRSTLAKKAGLVYNRETHRYSP